MKALNLKAFGFSISWTRIFPEGVGTYNPSGVDFYHKAIDYCLKKKGIEPWITLYHWDLPLALEEKGGWTNREILDWFSGYVDFYTKEYGSKVKKLDCFK
ncbi:MAG: family 1 glycosylhydrolase [Cytophagaceae bacterium]|nr:family 1 glycosylhydrolase [Cytophagaceae bacterium]